MSVGLPGNRRPPLVRIAWRVLLALSMIVFVAMIAYLDRGGYADADGSGVSLLDAFYYSTVSVTTTGYGDVRPESDSARLLTTLLVTPARVLFLIILVGTTLEILAERTRHDWRVSRWRRGLRDHVIVCGYGTKGRAAVRTLRARGTPAEDIVVIESDAEARAAAVADGLAAVAGDAAQAAVLRQAEVDRAASVVVAPNSDPAAVLITLTVRELNPGATIAAAAREEENVHLLHQSGANSVIVTSSSAGRLLGLATHAPRVVEVLEDLMSIGEGLDIKERPVDPGEAGPCSALPIGGPVIAVERGGELLRFDDPRAASVQAGDRIVYLAAGEDPR